MTPSILFFIWREWRISLQSPLSLLGSWFCLILKQRFSFPLPKITKLVNIPSSPWVLLKIKPYKHQHDAQNSGWPRLRLVKGNFQQFGLTCGTGKDQWFFMNSVSVLSETTDCRASPPIQPRSPCSWHARDVTVYLWTLAAPKWSSTSFSSLFCFTCWQEMKSSEAENMPNGVRPLGWKSWVRRFYYLQCP